MTVHFPLVQLSETERLIASNGMSRLTATEREILNLLVNAYSIKQIARMRNISERTAITHKNNIRNKLGSRNMSEVFKVIIGLAA